MMTTTMMTLITIKSMVTIPMIIMKRILLLLFGRYKYLHFMNLKSSEIWNF